MDLLSAFLEGRRNRRIVADFVIADAVRQRLRDQSRLVIGQVGCVSHDTSINLAEEIQDNGELHLLDDGEITARNTLRVKALGYRSVTAHAMTGGGPYRYETALKGLIQDGYAGRFDMFVIGGEGSAPFGVADLFLCDVLLCDGGIIVLADDDLTVSRGSVNRYDDAAAVDAPVVKACVVSGDDAIAVRAVLHRLGYALFEEAGFYVKL